MFFLKDSRAMNPVKVSPCHGDMVRRGGGDHAQQRIHARVWRQNQTPSTVIPASCTSAEWAGITKHHIKPFSSLSQKSQMEWGKHQVSVLARVPGEGSGFMNTWEQACELVFKQFQHIIKGLSQVNENQSSRPKRLFWKYLFFKDFAF